jgi:hypothetical protein
MLALIELLIAAFAIYSAVSFPEELKLLVPLLCLFLMLYVNRIDMKGIADKAVKKESANVKDQDFFTIESLLWPKNELLLIDAVHSVLKDLGLKISTGVKYHSVDRIVKIPNTEKAFGVEILMNEEEADQHHPKLRRALEFEKEKKESEKTLIIASTFVHLPLAERGEVKEMPEDLIDFLVRHKMSFMSTYQLYEFWQKAKGGGNDVLGVFQQLYSHPGGIFHLKDTENEQPLSVDLPIQ